MGIEFLIGKSVYLKNLTSSSESPSLSAHLILFPNFLDGLFFPLESSLIEIISGENSRETLDAFLSDFVGGDSTD